MSNQSITSWLASRTVASPFPAVQKFCRFVVRAVRRGLGRTRYWGPAVSKDASYVANLLADDRLSQPPRTASGDLPRISIVVPNFNQGRFLEACLTSILDQDYPDFELIVVDGGSTDESLQIMDRFGDRLTWRVSERDEGQADAINKGFHHCTGQIFNWVNADDRLTPGALRAVANAFLKDPSAAGWIGGCIRTDELGAVADIVYPNGFDRDHIGSNWNGKQFYQPSCFLSVEVLRGVGLLDPSLYIVLDLELWLRMLEIGPFVAGRGIWSTAINHEGAKTQHSVDRVFVETAELQDRLGFSAGATQRRLCLEGAPIRFVLGPGLRGELERAHGGASAAGSWHAGRAVPFQERSHLCLVGDFTTAIDAEAARFFLDEIVPNLVRSDDTEVHLLGPGASSLRLGRRKGRMITFREFPEDLVTAMQTYRLCIRPHRRPPIANELLLAALDAGTPIVSTTPGLGRLGPIDGIDCFVADSPLQFAEKCNQLLQDPIGWANFSIRSTLWAARHSANSV